MATDGQFTRELEQALLDGTADVAVHSMKDVPAQLEPGLVLAAVAVGSWLQRRITEPIVAVAETAHRVISTRDFSLRVDRRTTDEVAYLVDVPGS